jgi:hypothetical protein
MASGPTTGPSAAQCAGIQLSIRPPFHDWCCGPQFCVVLRVEIALVVLVSRWNGSSPGIRSDPRAPLRAAQ